MLNISSNMNSSVPVQYVLFWLRPEFRIRIRIQLFTFMRIRIRLSNFIADPDHAYQSDANLRPLINH
jgi:hypothetical protein